MTFDRFKSAFSSYPVTSAIFIIWLAWMGYFGFLISQGSSASTPPPLPHFLRYGCTEVDKRPRINLEWTGGSGAVNVLQRKVGKNDSWHNVVDESKTPFSYSYSDLLPETSKDPYFYRVSSGQDTLSNMVTILPISGCTLFPPK